MLNFIRQKYQQFKSRPINNLEIEDFRSDITMYYITVVREAKTWDETEAAISIRDMGMRALMKRDRHGVYECIRQLKAKL